MNVLMIISIVITSIAVLAVLPYIVLTAIDTARFIGNGVISGWKELIRKVFKK